LHQYLNLFLFKLYVGSIMKKLNELILKNLL